MKIISIANLKGGVGKTTITQNLAGVLQERGLRVLLLDMDHQANLTAVFENGEAPFERDATISRVLLGGATLSAVIQKTKVPGISLAPADLDLAFLDNRLGTNINAPFRLVEALAGQDRQFDYTLIDCPPHLGLATWMALVASHAYLVPVDAHHFSYQGALRLEEVVTEIRKRANRELRFLGYVLNRLQVRRKITESYVEQFKEQFGTKLLETQIRESVKYQEASSEGLPITTYLPTSDPADVFRSLAKEIGL
jgi:chromosome partitioning protein